MPQFFEEKLDQLKQVWAKKPSYKRALLSREMQLFIQKFNETINSQSREPNDYVLLLGVVMEMLADNTPNKGYTENLGFKQFFKSNIMNLFQELFSALEKDRQILEQQLNEATDPRFHETLEQRVQELTSVQFEKDGLEERLKQIENENKRLQNQLELARKTHEENVSSLQSELEAQRGKLKKVRAQGGNIDDLEDNIDNLERKLKRAKTEKEEAETELARLQKEYDAAKAHLLKVRTELEELKVQNSALEERNRTQAETLESHKATLRQHIAASEGTQQLMLAQTHALTQSVMSQSQAGFRPMMQMPNGFAPNMSANFGKSFAMSTMGKGDGYFISRLSKVKWLTQDTMRVFLYLIEQLRELEKQENTGNMHLKIFSHLVYGILFRPDASLHKIFIEAKTQMSTFQVPDQVKRCVNELLEQDEAVKIDKKNDVNPDLKFRCQQYQISYQYLFSTSKLAQLKKQGDEPFLPNSLYNEMRKQVKDFVETEMGRLQQQRKPQKRVSKKDIATVARHGVVASSAVASTNNQDTQQPSSNK